MPRKPIDVVEAERAGRRVINAETGEGYTVVPDNAVVELWICPRVDEPETWTNKPGTKPGRCALCKAPIVYNVSTAPNPVIDPRMRAVEKWCRQCAVESGYLKPYGQDESNRQEQKHVIQTA